MNVSVSPRTEPPAAGAWITVACRPSPSRRQVFDAFLRGILAVAALHHGYKRAVKGPPDRGDGVSRITIEFDGPDALERWNSGDAWQEWLEAARRLAGGALRVDEGSRDDG
jgi:antibiotic biosynthesis monooxygenase (ABM) superfamily enzyme